MVKDGIQIVRISQDAQESRHEVQLGVGEILGGLVAAERNAVAGVPQIICRDAASLPPCCAKCSSPDKIAGGAGRPIPGRNDRVAFLLPVGLPYSAPKGPINALGLGFGHGVSWESKRVENHAAFGSPIAPFWVS